MAILATFTFRATATNKNPEGLLSYDSTKSEMLKMQWMPCTELSSMDEKSACRWQSMEDHQIPINLEVIVIDNHHPTAVRGIDHVLVLLDAGLADHVPDLPGVVQSLDPAHHAKLATVAHSHQESRKAVLIPEVLAANDPTLGPVQNLVQDPDSLVPSLVLVPNLVQDHPGTKHRGLLLGLQNREGQHPQIALHKIMMTTLMVLGNNNKKVLMLKEEKTMLMINQPRLSLDFFNDL